MLKILKKTSDGHTGHITLDLQIVETDGNATTEGLLETHGIAPSKLKEMHGGDIKTWLRIKHREMLERHADRKIATKALDDLQGLTELKDEDAAHGTEDQV